MSRSEERWLVALNSSCQLRLEQSKPFLLFELMFLLFLVLDGGPEKKLFNRIKYCKIRILL